ncbi:XRE family transcriptional regulator [Jeongeupia chitinilytica]|uniref:XRE family transcriptional regulator n=1 Tax=Jeongeupia chitinilytica TaxID=1041641 RepID=A0ABQ3H1E8_9NEIS|nr:XRE family transcriptional regulator [Jeongeupia chitinilytica]GHD63752.1 hypothetical protein GCM10007350_21870 [Jeongeupia chitinilytica]
MTHETSRWLTLLRAEAERTSMRAVADRLGYSPASISLVLGDKYPGKTDRIAAAVLAKLDTIACPHLGQALTGDLCRQYALRDVPTSSPAAAAHWRACQSCKHRDEVCHA